MLDLISQQATVPIYGVTTAYLGRGMIGGSLINRGDIEYQVATIALRIANGARPKDIPVEEVGLTPWFDWRQLKRWGISESSLPAGSDVRFRELTFWDRSNGGLSA